MAAFRPPRSVRAAALVLVAGLALAGACSPAPRAGVTVSGKTVFQGMGVEEVQLEAVPDGLAGEPTTVRGHSGYHGSFALRLEPGTYQLTAQGALPGTDGTTRPLWAVRSVTVAPGLRRLDQVVVELRER